MSKELDLRVRVETDKDNGKIIAVYLRFRKGQSAKIRELANGSAFADYDFDGRLLGVEVLLPCNAASSEAKSHFLRIAEALMSKGNKPQTARWIMKATGISRNSLSQILHRTHKDSFVSTLMPGYTRKKLWSLSEAGQAACPKQPEET